MSETPSRTATGVKAMTENRMVPLEQYEAMVCAHDAAMAEAERELDEERSLQYGEDWDQLESSRDEWKRRAEAAEAQLAQARADGARSMASLIALRQGMRALPIYDQIAAWQAHETEEGRSDD